MNKEVQPKNLSRKEITSHWHNLQYENAGNLLENSNKKIEVYIDNHLRPSPQTGDINQPDTNHADRLSRSFTQRIYKLQKMHEGLEIKEQLRMLPEAQNITALQLDTLSGNLVTLRRQLLKQAEKHGHDIEAVNMVLTNAALATMDTLINNGEFINEPEDAMQPKDIIRHTKEITKITTADYIQGQTDGKKRGAKKILLQKAQSLLDTGRVQPEQVIISDPADNQPLITKVTPEIYPEEIPGLENVVFAAGKNLHSTPSPSLPEIEITTDEVRQDQTPAQETPQTTFIDNKQDLATAPILLPEIPAEAVELEEYLPAIYQDTEAASANPNESDVTASAEPSPQNISTGMESLPETPAPVMPYTNFCLVLFGVHE